MEKINNDFKFNITATEARNNACCDTNSQFFHDMVQTCLNIIENRIQELSLNGYKCYLFSCRDVDCRVPISEQLGNRLLDVIFDTIVSNGFTVHSIRQTQIVISWD